MPEATMHVAADRDVCVGAGLCALTAPDVFDQDEEGIVTVLADHPPGEARDAVLRVETLCPSGAVRVTRRVAGGERA
ncbi:ferredoxin [Actinosynnema sp. CS-041913]|uniref:ferredoxin n=1 Tax=Actinosynnema sp. CS-041913 TaxID=3239917 RepID=UPI003D89D082